MPINTEPTTPKCTMILLASVIIANIIDTLMIPEKFFEDKEHIDFPVDEEINSSCRNTSNDKNNKKL